MSPRNEDSDTHIHRLITGFNVSALAATFIAAIQSQIMSSTLQLDSPSRAIQATNFLYLAGLIFDLTSALVSFLTARWLQILLTEEKEHLENCFEKRVTERRARGALLPVSMHNQIQTPSPKHPKRSTKSIPLSIRYMSISLFSSFFILKLGVLSLLAGLEIFVWATQPHIVAVLVSVVYLCLAPFVVGIFLIGDSKERRSLIIERLSWKTGDW